MIGATSHGAAIMSGTPGHSGRRHKPSLIKKIEGNRRKVGKARIRDDVKGKGLPECPLYLTAEHRKKWALAIAALPDGVVTRADSAILESFCISWQLIEDFAIAIQKSDKLVRGPNGAAVHNPHLSILFRAQKEIALCRRRAGLDAGRASPADPRAEL